MNGKVALIKDRYIKYVSNEALRTHIYINQYLYAPVPLSFYNIENNTFVQEPGMFEYVHHELKICSNDKILFEAFVDDILLTFFNTLLIDFYRQINLLFEYENRFVLPEELLQGNRNIQFVNGQLSILYLQIEDSRIQYIIDRYVNYIFMSDLLEFKINIVGIVGKFIKYSISYNTNNVILNAHRIRSNLDKLDLVTILETMGVRIKCELKHEDLIKLLITLISRSRFRKVQLHYYINRIHQKSLDDKNAMSNLGTKINTLEDLFEHFDELAIMHQPEIRKHKLNIIVEKITSITKQQLEKYILDCETYKKRISIERKEYQIMSKYCNNS